MKQPNIKIIIAVVIFAFIFSMFTVMVYSSELTPISAKSASLYEPKSKTFVYEKNSGARLAMASTTKIMTALVAYEEYPLDAPVSVPAEACGIEGSSLYLKEGEVLTMKDMLTGLMLRSANDAAVAVAIAVSGSVDAFADKMNEKAAELQLKDTHFVNPHGLDDENHYTTARELAIISAEALNKPEILEICSMKRAVITNFSGEARLVVNHNKLLSLYEGAVGVKTGFTKKSGRSLVGAAIRDGVMLISVTINDPDDWQDHKRLFDLGFSVMERKLNIQKGDYSYSIPILNKRGGTVTVENDEEFEYIARKDDGDITEKVLLDRFFTEEKSVGQAVGRVIFYKGNEIVKEIPLIVKAQDKT